MLGGCQLVNPKVITVNECIALPAKPWLPVIKKAELMCMANDARFNLKMREYLIFGYVEKLEASILSACK